MEQQKKALDFLTPKLTEITSEKVKKDKMYQALQARYERQTKNHQYIQAIQTKNEIDKIVRSYAEQIAANEVMKRKSDEKIIEMLPTQDDKDKYTNILTGLCMCFDMIDFLIGDVNALMLKCGTGFTMEELPEVSACRERVASMVEKELNEMNGDVQNIYTSEVDLIYNQLRKRTDVYRRRLNNLKAGGE